MRMKWKIFINYDKDNHHDGGRDDAIEEYSMATNYRRKNIIV